MMTCVGLQRSLDCDADLSTPGSRCAGSRLPQPDAGAPGRPEHWPGRVPCLYGCVRKLAFLVINMVYS
jgi:hypothetical protein